MNVYASTMSQTLRPRMSARPMSVSTPRNVFGPSMRIPSRPVIDSRRSPATARLPTERSLSLRAATVSKDTATTAPDSDVETTFDISRTLLLQGFGWDSCEKDNWYKTVMEKIPAIKAVGFTHIWLPPPSESVADQGYLPGQLYNLDDSSYGNQEELTSLVGALKEAGIRSVCDIVINHRCADGQDEFGVWNQFGDDVDHPGESVAWGRWAITSDDPDFRGKGSQDSGDDYGPAPDLDHTNDTLRSSLKDWMRWLISDIGFHSFRFDFVKGFSGTFAGEYIKDTGCAEKFNVGEYWVDLIWEGSNLAYDQNGPRQTLVDWVKDTDNTATAFDFPTKGILQEAVKNTEYWRLIDEEGKPPGLLGWWPSKACTFIDNHDTGSTQQHWPFPVGKELIGYAYLFTHPGIPCVFWDHLFQYSEDILALKEMRTRVGLHSRSEIVINIAEADIYIATIDDKVRVKLGPRPDLGEYMPTEEDGWTMGPCGTEWAIWEKA